MMQPPAFTDTSHSATSVSIEDLIDYLLARRAMVIMELRDIDRRLIQYGRLRQETLPRRVR